MNEILSKLNLLRNADKEFSIFGARSHGYKLNPVLSLDDFKKVEKKYNCSFPQDYREFITKISNGGPGPAYGVFPFGFQDDGHDLSEWEGGYLIGDLSKPFPYSSEWNMSPEFWAQEPDLDGSFDEEKEEEVWDAWQQKIEAEYWTPEVIPGAIPICHLGCARRVWLVVTGPMTGTVWNDYRCDYDGLEPVLNIDKKPATFNDWYIAWLDESFAELRVE